VTKENRENRPNMHDANKIVESILICVQRKTILLFF
jgi:hypothetical protein